MLWIILGILLAGPLLIYILYKVFIFIGGLAISVIMLILYGIALLINKIYDIKNKKEK